jgi:hypothetical protein
MDLFHLVLEVVVLLLFELLPYEVVCVLVKVDDREEEVDVVIGIDVLNEIPGVFENFGCDLRF